MGGLGQALPSEEQVAELLRETATAHRLAFESTQGFDPDWPAWYAGYLAVPLGRLLGRALHVEALAAELKALDEAQRRDAPDAEWPVYYAALLVQRSAT